MADDRKVPKRTKHARWMLRQSEKALRDVLDGFDAMQEMMQSGEAPSISEIMKARTALGNTRAQLLEEVNKYERHILLSKGLIDEAPIDFDAIKDQIGSRLDRLRATRETD
jgi:hypothetical protein